MHIFCDGACKGNGQKKAVAGWAYAVWIDEIKGEPFTYDAGRLESGPATNQRAELTALFKALTFAKSFGGPIIIYTDSLYSLNCTTKWGPAWKKAGWKRSSGEPLLNLDLIIPLVDLDAELQVIIKHVRGHQTNTTPEAWGNNWVDRAASEKLSM